MVEGRNDYIGREEYNHERNKISDKMMNHESRIVILEAMYENLSKLPMTIQNLDKTMALMERNLSSLNEEFKEFVSKSDKNDDDLSKIVNGIDGKSKIDFLLFIKKNWVSVFLFIATLVMIVSNNMG